MFKGTFQRKWSVPPQVNNVAVIPESAVAKGIFPTDPFFCQNEIEQESFASSSLKTKVYHLRCSRSLGSINKPRFAKHSMCSFSDELPVATSQDLDPTPSAIFVGGRSHCLCCLTLESRNFLEPHVFTF